MQVDQVDVALIKNLKVVCFGRQSPRQDRIVRAELFSDGRIIHPLADFLPRELCQRPVGFHVEQAVGEGIVGGEAARGPSVFVLS